MIFFFCSEVFVLKIRNPKGISSNDTSLDKAASVSFEFIDQKREIDIKK